MTRLTQTCVQLSRADAALMHAFRVRQTMSGSRELATPQNRMGIAGLQHAASQAINTLRFIGPDFAAANDNTMVMGVA